MPFLASKRLGVITEDQLQQALDRHDRGKLIDAEPIPCGLFGQNILVRASSGDYVLRGSPHADDQLPLERFFAQIIHERSSVPVPWPYLIDPQPDIFGWSYALMPRMPGVQLDEEQKEQLGIGARCSIAAAMGRTLAEIANITWPHSGPPDVLFAGNSPGLGPKA